MPVPVSGGQPRTLSPTCCEPHTLASSSRPRYDQKAMSKATPEFGARHHLEALGLMWNTLDCDRVLASLCDETVWESQRRLSPLVGRDQIGNHLILRSNELSRVTESKRPVAAIARIYGYRGEEPCLVIFQSSATSPDTVVFVESEGSKLLRVDLCVVPDPQSAEIAEDFPGLNHAEARRRIANLGTAPGP